MSKLTRKIVAFDPYDDSKAATREVGLEESQVNALLRENGEINDKVRLARLALAQQVVQNPDAVFEGWQRPDQDDGLCYVGRPKHDYPRLGIEVPAPPGMVFCVYIVSSGKMVAWRWEKGDEIYDNDDRFGRKIWPV